MEGLKLPGAVRRTWRVPDASGCAPEIELSGWDWGGAGPLALLHHANGLCAATWALVAEGLRGGLRVVAMDARGHGDSAAPPIPEGYAWNYHVADLTGVARALLAETGHRSLAWGIGSSFGGILTAAAEARAPGLFDRIAMFDPPIHPPPELLARLGVDMPPAAVERRETLVAQTRARRAVWPSRASARQAWRRKAMFANWREEAFDLYLAEGFRDLDGGEVELKCDPEVEAIIFDTTGAIDLFDEAPAIAPPVLLVHAARGFFPIAVYRHLTDRLPQGTLASLDGGHLLPLEVPDLCVAALDKFASSC